MKELQARAYYVGNELKLDEIDKKTDLHPIVRKRDFLLYELAPDTFVVAYSFGVWVFIGYDQKLEKAYIKKYLRFVSDPQEKYLSEEYAVVIDENTEKELAEFNRAVFRKIDPGRLMLLSEVLAQSVAMDYFDGLVEIMAGRLEKMNTDLSSRGSLPSNTKAIIKLLGTDNLILQRILARLSILDAPDLVWENEEYEKPYASLRTIFDLDDRFKAIESKLGFIQSNSQFFIDLIQSRRSDRLEITILLVIIFETFLVLLELFR